MTNTRVPILGIDIDGVLSPQEFTKLDRRLLTKRGFRQIEWRRSFVPEPGRWTPLSSLWLNPAHGRMLADFSARHDVELVWFSLWGSNSSPIAGRSIGLPRLPYVDFHNHWSGSEVWKWDAVAEYAAGRPLAWLDDGFGRAAVRRKSSGFDRARRNLPTLLQPVCPWEGLVAADLTKVAEWLALLALAW